MVKYDLNIFVIVLWTCTYYQNDLFPLKQARPLAKKCGEEQEAVTVPEWTTSYFRKHCSSSSWSSSGGSFFPFRRRSMRRWILSTSASLWKSLCLFMSTDPQSWRSTATAPQRSPRAWRPSGGWSSLCCGKPNCVRETAGEIPIQIHKMGEKWKYRNQIPTHTVTYSNCGGANRVSIITR